jgi:hypothetical protein
MPLDDLRLQLTRKVTSTARILANDWEKELKDNSPVDTGEMRERTTTDVSARAGGIEVTAKVDTEYAEMVAGGTRPHVITPRTARSLRFVASSGEVVYAQRVNHPGAQPETWWADTNRRLPDMVQRAWRAAR